MRNTRISKQVKPVLCSLGVVICCMLNGSPGIGANTTEQQTPSMPASPTPTLPVATPNAVPVAGKEAARAIAAQIVAAYGGIKVLKDVNDVGYHAHATLCSKLAFSDATNSIDTDIYYQGNKLRVETLMRGQKHIMGYDGKVCWTQDGSWVSGSTPQQTKEFTESLSHGLELLASFEDPAVKIETRDSQIVAGKPCDVLVVTPASGKSTTFFADQKTHLIAKTEYLGVDHQQGVPAVQGTEYDDWRPIDGTLMPFKSTAFCGGKQRGTIIVKVYETAKVSDQTFAMPAESQIAEIQRDPVVLPFEYVGSHIVVNAKINRQLDCKLIVDTGAGITTLSQSFAQRLASVSTSNLVVGTVTKSVTANYAVLDSLSLGRVTVNDISAVVGEFPVFDALPGEHPVGLLGADVLKRFLVTINFQDKTLTLSNPKVVNVPPNAFVLTTSPIFSNALVVTGRVDDKKDVNFLVDTGASINHLPSSAVQALVPGPILAVGEVRGLGKSVDHTGAAIFKTLKIDRLTVKNPVFSVELQKPKNEHSEGILGSAPIGLLGVPLWSNFIVSVDYINGRLILEPLPEYLELQEYQAQCDAINLKFLQTGDLSHAVAAFAELQQHAKQKNLTACEALVLTEAGYCCTNQYLRTRSGSSLQQAMHYIQEAYNLPIKSNRRLKARILALWAFVDLQSNTPQAVISARDLLLRADEQTKNEPLTYAVTGSRLFEIGNDAIAKQAIKQSLSLDPANWIGLETAYKLFARQGDKQNQALTLAQMKRYYPGVPVVADMEKQFAAKK